MVGDAIDRAAAVQLSPVARHDEFVIDSEDQRGISRLSAARRRVPSGARAMTVMRVGPGSNAKLETKVLGLFRVTDC